MRNQVPATQTRKGLPSNLAEVFSVHPKSLGLFRIFLGMSLFVDLIIRLQDLKSMYLDSGIFPRSLIKSHYPTSFNWSLHFFSDSAHFQIFLFIVGIAAATGMILGVHSRWAALIGWILTLSLHNRVPPILNGSDALVKLLLLWSTFLPLDRTWSLLNTIRGRGKTQPTDTPICSFGTAAIMIQMAMMYLASAVYKTNADWFRGDVIDGTLTHDFYAKPLGELAAKFPLALKLLTWSIFALEWLGPIALLVPRCQPWLRNWALAGLMAMHLGIELLVHVGMFSIVSIAGLMIFIPGNLWKQPSKALVKPNENIKPHPPTSGGFQENHFKFQNLNRPLERICALLLVYVIYLNVSGLLNHFIGTKIFPSSRFLDLSCGLGQRWSMFEDTPSMDGWYVARTELVNGTIVDLMQGGKPLDWSRPTHPAATYPNHRWRKLFREMGYTDGMGFQRFREPVARYLTQKWNSTNTSDLQVKRFELLFCTDESSRPTPGLAPRQLLLRMER